MSDQSEAAVRTGAKLVERAAARYACDKATLNALFVAACTPGGLPTMSPDQAEKFIEDTLAATWRAMRHGADDRRA